mgnify:CR=1 FL=1
MMYTIVYLVGRVSIRVQVEANSMADAITKTFGPGGPARAFYCVRRRIT